MFRLARIGQRASACSVVSPFNRKLYIAMSAALPAAVSVRPIPLFDDNYCWVLRDSAHSSCVLVDPADPDAVSSALSEADGEAVAALITHHHWDHAGGSEVWASKGLEVIAGEVEGASVKGASKRVADGESFTAGHIPVRALHVPCHTRGHVAYFIDGAACADGVPIVFTGDTLFAGGCGKFFEGTAEQMAGSLAKLAALPPQTRVYCGHEYTVSNLKFCLHVEPDNADTRARLADAIATVAAGKPTVPSSIDLELKTNVFMRTHLPAVQRFTHPELFAADGAVPAAGAAALSVVEVMARLREAKNTWKPPA